MGNQLVWQERYNIGVDLIDKEHQKLFRILNKLFDFKRQEEKSPWACQEAVKYFREHTLQHFADEEDYMASVHYAAAVQTVKLLLPPDIVVLPGSKITVTQNKITEDYTSSGIPALYVTHQEIVLELFERWV